MTSMIALEITTGGRVIDDLSGTGEESFQNSLQNCIPA